MITISATPTFEIAEKDKLTTPVASANCAIYCNAQIDFVDIDEKTSLISIDALKIKLEIAKANDKLPKREGR